MKKYKDVDIVAELQKLVDSHVAVSYTHLDVYKRQGYDMDIIPSDLATFGGEAKRLLQDLQTRNERLFLVTILIMNTATNRQNLENAVFQLSLIHIYHLSPDCAALASAAVPIIITTKGGKRRNAG